MILNDKQIAELCIPQEFSKKGWEGMINPFVPKKVREELIDIREGNMKTKVISYGCSHFGYDIRLSTKDFKIFAFRHGFTVVDPKYQGDHFEFVSPPKTVGGENTVLIPPHGYALGVSLEKFNMPDDIIGICLGKSTYARCGVIVNLTPLEPGWKGHLTIEISNANPLPVVIYLGEGIAQVIFFKGDKPSSKYEGKYQNQEEQVYEAQV